jgi:hypothetical protein
MLQLPQAPLPQYLANAFAGDQELPADIFQRVITNAAAEPVARLFGDVGADERGATRLRRSMLRRCGSAMRPRPALGPRRAFDHWPSPRLLPAYAAVAGSVPAQIAFLDDALVRLAHALDAVLRLAAVVRKRTDHLELAIGRGAQRAAQEAHGLASAKLMTHVYLTFDTWNR